MAAGMMQAPPPPERALVEAVHGERWAEVRALTSEAPAPSTPVVALLAARAMTATGDPGRALAVLRRALPRAGALAPALRLEAAGAAHALGRDPWPLLAPLLRRRGTVAQRRAASSLLRSAWETLPLSTLRRVPRRSLPYPLRRRLDAVVAIRSADRAAALKVLGERIGDESALRVARWLASTSGLDGTPRLDTAEALLAGGAWREAEEVLAPAREPDDPHGRWRLWFLHGRAAYRLGKLADAAGAFDRALAGTPSPEDAFAAAVQRGRIAEIEGDLVSALALFDRALAAQPREVEGWDGALRDRAALGRGEEAVALAAHCPAPVLEVVGPRLAAGLLLRNDLPLAAAVLARLPARLAVARVLEIALHLRRGEADEARTLASAFVADPGAGAWRDAVLDLFPTRPAAELPPTRDAARLATMAVGEGPPSARRALTGALASDPAWARVLCGAVEPPSGWEGPARALADAGLERDAARLFPEAFPTDTPGDLAWTAKTLAEWGNATAALSAGEALWARLGPLPAALVPDALLPVILPRELLAGCAAAATRASVPPPWLAAVVRQESRFDAEAFSSAGAVGVAQMMPEVARQLGGSTEDLRDGQRAIRLAARELARLTAAFGPRLVPVASAYNAGEAVVRTWLALLGTDGQGPLLIAAIPYRETSQYALAVRQGVELSRYLLSVPLSKAN